jgi:ketosteroid isomerase-like protein
MMTDLLLPQYYRALDADDFEGALALLAPDVTFLIAIPGAPLRGQSREGVAAYLAGRGDVVRRHEVLRCTSDGDLEFVYGAVVEDGTRVTGHFLAAARANPDGRLGSYHVSFDAETALLPDAAVTR